MNLTELKKMPVPALVELAQSMEIEGIVGPSDGVRARDVYGKRGD